jgi:hypothetical protein
LLLLLLLLLLMLMLMLMLLLHTSSYQARDTQFLLHDVDNTCCCIHHDVDHTCYCTMALNPKPATAPWT